MMRYAFASTVLLVLFAATATADFLVTKDGRVVDGKKITRAEGGVRVAFENGEVFVAEALIGDLMIDGEALAPAVSEEEKLQAAKGMVRFEGRWMTPKSRDAELKKRMDKRLADLQLFKEHSQWRNRHKVSSKNFEFEHTLMPEVFENYRELMEAYFAQFLRDWKIAPPKGLGKLKVCLYSNYDDMIQIGGAGGGVLGYFRFIPPLELNFFHERLDVAFTEEVMFHETNHYLQKLMDMEFSMPHFPGESLAEYYGASHWDPVKKKLTTGLILEGRLVEVQDDIAGGTMMSLEKLVSTGRMYEHYTWGWTLAHFLMNDKRYAPKFQKFIVGLVSAKDVKREVNGQNLKDVEPAEVFSAFKRYLDIKDGEALKKLEEEWHAYVKEKLTLVTPRGKEEAAKSAMNTGRSIKAKRLFKEAIEGGSTNPMTFHRYAGLLARDNKKDEALAMWKKAIAMDPLTGEYYWDMAWHVKDEAEQKRLRKLAKELDPDGSYSELIDLTGLKDGDG